jgi:hypothetical protein
MILAGVMLAGCGGLDMTAQQAGTQNAPDTCNAAAHQGLIGADAAASLVLPEPKRLAGPFDPVTTDYVAGRLNVQLSETDTIVAITCG